MLYWKSKSFIGNDFSNGYLFICKIGKKEKVKYVFLDCIRPYNKKIVDEIIEANENSLILKQFVSFFSKFNINIWFRVCNKKIQNDNKKNVCNSHSENSDNCNFFNLIETIIHLFYLL